MSEEMKWFVGITVSLLIGAVGGGTLWKGGWRVIRLVTEEDLQLTQRFYSREEGAALERKVDELKVWVVDEGIGPLKSLGKAVQDMNLALAALSAQSSYVLRSVEEVKTDVRAMRQESEEPHA